MAVYSVAGCLKSCPVIQCWAGLLLLLKFLPLRLAAPKLSVVQMLGEEVDGSASAQWACRTCYCCYIITYLRTGQSISQTSLLSHQFNCSHNTCSYTYACLRPHGNIAHQLPQLCSCICKYCSCPRPANFFLFLSSSYSSHSSYSSYFPIFLFFPRQQLVPLATQPGQYTNPEPRKGLAQTAIQYIQWLLAARASVCTVVKTVF